MASCQGPMDTAPLQQDGSRVLSVYIPRRGLVRWPRASRKLVLPYHGERMVRCSSVVEAVGGV